MRRRRPGDWTATWPGPWAPEETDPIREEVFSGLSTELGVKILLILKAECENVTPLIGPYNLACHNHLL